MTRKDDNDFFGGVEKLPESSKYVRLDRMEYMKIPKERKRMRAYKPYKCVKEWIPDGQYVGSWQGAHIEVFMKDVLWMIPVNRDVTTVSEVPVQVSVKVAGRSITVQPLDLNTEGLRKVFGKREKTNET